jgi:hypothetical protein
MTSAPFTHHREAALALLGKVADLTLKEAGFLGHVCITAVLSDRQLAWLARLLARHGLPVLASGGAA